MSRLDCYAMKDCLVKRMESYKNRETSTVILFLLKQKDGVNTINLNNRPLLLEMNLCDSDLDGFSLHKLKLIISACSGRGYLFGASCSNACLNYLYCFPYPFDGLAALLYFEPFNLSLFYSIAIGLQTTDKPIVKRQIESHIDFAPLPLDYNNWSSTLIIFAEKKYEITAYAFDFEHSVVYYLVSYKRSLVLYEKMGYTVGDIDAEDDGYYDSFSLEAYDILNRQWITDDFPMLNAPKPSPFMFFLDGRLYVLSSSWGANGYSECLPEKTHFEMLDLNNLSQGWVFLPAPSFVEVWGDILSFDNTRIIDYSKKILYVRMLEFPSCSDRPLLYGYSLHDNTWHEHGGPRSWAGRPSNLLKSLWSNNCVIVENYLYRFEVFGHPDDDCLGRASLIIADLEQENNIQWVEFDNVRYLHEPPLDGVWEVDISSIVAPDVLSTFCSYGDLIYLGKRNSGQRFLLVISYVCESCSGATYLCTCTFDLRRSSTSLEQATAVGESSTESFIFSAVGKNSTEFIFENVCCQYQHKYMVPDQIFCHKLCNEM